ncbi:MAG: redoxin family protein [Hyphomicrobiales bacterium]
MLLALLAFAAGALTIVSPCILPVLPFVFARAGRPFATSILPLLVGMALTFAVVASLAAIAGGWVVEANRFGRFAALAVLAFFGLTLVFPGFAARVMQPLVRLGQTLSETPAGQGRGDIAASFALGVATGFLWAPCAGPVLGLILAGAAINGASVATSLLLLAYAAGAASALALALLIGGRVFALMKRGLGASDLLRRALGLAVLASVLAIAFGLDTGFLTRVSATSTASVERSLMDRLTQGGLGSLTANPPKPVAAEQAGAMPSFAGAVTWLNSSALTPDQLKGKVVLVDFWTYSCINCLRGLPYLEAWAKKYGDLGLVVIGVHAPEFAFERDVENVRKAAAENGVTYPIAIDNGFEVWDAFGNQAWPAHYLFDAKGRLRHQHIGEGEYDETERLIQSLLAEANGKPATDGLVQVSGTGAQAAAAMAEIRSPETYIGSERADGFASPGGLSEGESRSYRVGALSLNEWGLTGTWTVGREMATLDASGGSIAFQFQSRDLHLVLGPGAAQKPVRFVVTIDGKPPGESHGSDVAADGSGTVTSHRLYQLVRQPGAIRDHRFEIRFLDPAVEAYAFTFG